MMKRFIEDFDAEVHAIDIAADDPHQGHDIERIEDPDTPLPHRGSRRDSQLETESQKL